MMSETHSTNTADLVTVPREPTDAMLDAGRIPGWDDPEHEGSCIGHPETRADIYRAMVAAAPALAASPAHATGAMREVETNVFDFEAHSRIVDLARNLRAADRASLAKALEVMDPKADAAEEEKILAYWMGVAAQNAKRADAAEAELRAEQNRREIDGLDALYAGQSWEEAARREKARADRAEAVLSSPAQEGEAAPVRTDADGVRKIVWAAIKTYMKESHEDGRSHRVALDEAVKSAEAEMAALPPEGETGPAVADDGFEVRLQMLGDGRFYDEQGGEWELTQATYEERTKNCQCSHCVERRAALTVSPPPSERDQHQGETLREAVKTLPDLGERMDKASDALGDLLRAADDRAAAGDVDGKARIIDAYKALFGTIKVVSGALVSAIIERDQAREEAGTIPLRSAASEVNSKNHGPWYLGAMNDGLFIIDKPPHLTTDPGPVDWPDGPELVLNVVALRHDQAQAIVDAHNATVFALRENIASNAVQLAFSKNDRIELAKCREELVEMDGTLRKLTAAASKARQALAGYLDPSQAAFELDVAMSKAMQAPPSDDSWPNGCIKPSSCARHKSCMYGTSGSCKHADRYIKEEVEAALSPEPLPVADKREGDL